MDEKGKEKVEDPKAKEEANVHKYIEQMNAQQRRAHLIASTHLRSSFNITRSNGYKEFLKSVENVK
jgi:hypothetical protein